MLGDLAMRDAGQEDAERATLADDKCQCGNPLWCVWSGIGETDAGGANHANDKRFRGNTLGGRHERHAGR